MLKALSAVPVLKTYVRLHAALTFVYALLWIALKPAWPRLRQSTYSVLTDDLPIILARPKAHPLCQLMTFVLPHAVNALPSMLSSVPHALFVGCVINLSVAGTAAIMIAALRLLPAHKRSAASSLFLSALLSAEITAVLFWIGHLFFRAPTNFKVPTVAVNLWPDVIVSCLVQARVLDPSSWKAASLLPLMEDRNLREIESFLTVRGVSVLYKIMTSSSVNPIKWLLSAVPLALRAGSIIAFPLCLGVIGFVADVTVVFVKLRCLLGQWRFLSGLRIVKRALFPPFLYSGLALGIGFIYLMHYPKCTMPDRLPRLHSTNEPLDYLLFTRSIPAPNSSHLRINLDIFLPFQVLKDWIHWHAHPTDEQPRHWTFLSATRYNRRTTLRWPFTALHVWDQNAIGSVAIWTWPLTRGLLKNGVPVVVVDTRGSGASRGTRPIDLDEPEIRDIARAVSWTKEQFWSNGKVAAGGVSYDGMTGLKVAALQDSQVDATIALYSPMHPVTELFQSDGMPCATFVDDYHSLTRAFEQDGSPLRHFMQARTSHVPLQITAGFLFSFRLPQPARGWEEGLEAKHLALRKQNWSLKGVADSKYFIDDTLNLIDGRRVIASEGGVTIQDYQHLANRKIPTYWTAAQCDSSAVRALQKYFPSLDHEEVGHTLLIGPWGHGGRRGCQLGNATAGSWACGEEDVYADVADFIKRDARRKTSEAWTWVDGATGHWTQTHHTTSSTTLSDSTALSVSTTQANPTTQADSTDLSGPTVFSLDGELMRESFPVLSDDSSWSICGLLARVFIPPRAWTNDLFAHLNSIDFFGVAHDLTELGVIAGSRLNELYDTAVATLRHWRFGKNRQCVLNPPTLEIPMLHRDVTSSISTTGGLSRWSIVQHLLRTPLDTNYVLDLRLGLSRYLQSVFHHQPAELTLEVAAPRSDAGLSLQGIPRVTIPFIFFASDFPAPNSTYDMGVVAILESLSQNNTSQYLSEGRALLSMRAHGQDHTTFANASAMMEFLKKPLGPTFAFRPHTRSRQLFLSDLFRANPFPPWAILTQVSFDMEAVSADLAAENKLRLTLLPEDAANFPWHRVERKFERYYGGEEKLRPVTQWHIARLAPAEVPLNGHLTLELPLIRKQ